MSYHDECQRIRDSARNEWAFPQAVLSPPGAQRWDVGTVKGVSRYTRGWMVQLQLNLAVDSVLSFNLVGRAGGYGVPLDFAKPLGPISSGFRVSAASWVYIPYPAFSMNVEELGTATTSQVQLNAVPVFNHEPPPEGVPSVFYGLERISGLGAGGAVIVDIPVGASDYQVDIIDLGAGAPISVREFSNVVGAAGLVVTAAYNVSPGTSFQAQTRWRLVPPGRIAMGGPSVIELTNTNAVSVDVGIRYRYRLGWPI